MEQMNQINNRSRSICSREENSKQYLPPLYGNKEENSKQYLPPLCGNNTVKNSFGKTFFHQEKDKGDSYFMNTRVGSCRKVLVKNGITLAMAYKIRNSKGEPLENYNHTLKKIPKNTSTYFFDYCTPKTENHVGMCKKPLVPYEPDHSRNQLMEDYGVRMRRNFSSVNIGCDSLINRKQWISTYKDSFKKLKIKRISNPGILSDLAKRTHYKFNNIEFP